MCSAAQWLSLQRQTGGDFSLLQNFYDQVPPIASVWLDETLTLALFRCFGNLAGIPADMT